MQDSGSSEGPPEKKLRADDRQWLEKWRQKILWCLSTFSHACKNFAHTWRHAVVPLGAHCPMHAWADVVLSFPCRHAGINYNGFVGYRGDDGRPGNCSNFEKLNLLACMANAIIHRTHAYVATFGSSRGIFRRTCTSTHIVTTVPFADRGSMVRLLVDSHLLKVGS